MGNEKLSRGSMLVGIVRKTPGASGFCANNADAVTNVLSKKTVDNTIAHGRCITIRQI